MLPVLCDSELFVINSSAFIALANTFVCSIMLTFIKVKIELAVFTLALVIGVRLTNYG